MENLEKKVSVLTPCFNGEDYIERYFDALLKQTYDNFEIVFVDDGSTDKTASIVKKYIKKFKDRNVELKYVYQENGGQASAINNGLKIISGDYLIWPDSDDYLEKNALKILAKELDKDESLSSVRGNVIYREDKTLKEIEIGKPEDKNKMDLFLDYLLFTKNVHCFVGIMMIRLKDFIEANKGLDISTSRAGQNWQILLPITYNRKCKYIDKNVYNYVVRQESHSHQKRSIEKELDKQKSHKNLLLEILNKIDITEKEKKIYCRMVNKKYNKIIIKLWIKTTLFGKFLLKIKNRGK
ncbi:MAG: glycosyltransferase family 2 protein [Firmicutes bacterium]|nr:glycosyltransferase family 2 protein [Bacillota bacterium]